MTDIQGLAYYEVDFNADGSLDTATGGGDGGLPAAVGTGAVTDVFVLSHGWNNGVDSARDLYQAMFALLAGQLGAHLATSVGVGVIWPSLLFPDDDPATASAVPSTGTQLADALSPAFPAQPQQLATMGQMLDQQPQDPTKLNEFHELAKGLVTTAPQGVEDSGEAALLTADTATAFGHAAAMATQAQSAAQGIGNPFAGLWSGAREVLRTLSYYEMKNRAGVVGQHGLGPLLSGLTGPGGPPRIHLMGHSFGARLVAYTLAGLRDDQTGAASPIKSLTLIQGAFSHFAFAPSLMFDASRSGALASYAGRVDGPMLATFTAADRAVGWWYPAASMLAGQDSESASDLVYRWGGMGHDGYQQTPTPDTLVLAAQGKPYDLRAGNVYALDANAVICNSLTPFSGAHSDIRHPEVLWAVVSAAGLTQ